MREITVNASTDKIGTVTDFVNKVLKEAECPDPDRIQIDIAIDEIFGNIARYAYGPSPGQASVRVETEADPAGVAITFTDRGIPYNPLTAEAPDTTLPAKKRTAGGLGLFMVRKTMDEISYSYRDSMNILIIRKYF